MNQAIFEESIRNGCSPRLAEMFASGKPPLAKSDTQFFAGQACGGGSIPEEFAREHHMAAAKEAGVDVTGAYYRGELARFPGDPEAWVRTRQDVKDVLERRGWSCTGDITVKPPCDPGAGAAPTPLADDIADRLTAERLAENPDARVADVREQVVADHGSQV